MHFILLMFMSVSGIGFIQVCKGQTEPLSTFKTHPSPYNLYGAQYPRI